jgi:hypothetical protein
MFWIAQIDQVAPIVDAVSDASNRIELAGGLLIFAIIISVILFIVVTSTLLALARRSKADDDGQRELYRMNSTAFAALTNANLAQQRAMEAQALAQKEQARTWNEQTTLLQELRAGQAKAADDSRELRVMTGFVTSKLESKIDVGNEVIVRALNMRFDEQVKSTQHMIEVLESIRDAGLSTLRDVQRQVAYAVEVIDILKQRQSLQASNGPPHEAAANERQTPPDGGVFVEEEL